jgi:Raf kinase inhibitor-like YbhB/YbcL family protein
MDNVTAYPNPYQMLEKLPRFELDSQDVRDGQKLQPAQISTRLGGQDLSPHLAWRSFPDATASFVVTAYDPDAPTPSGFWHWAVYNLPKSATELLQGAGNIGGKLPSGAIILRNDRGTRDYIGAAPPPGTGRHRYYFVVYALDVAKLDLTDDTTPTVLTFTALAHTLAWASLVGWYEQV